MKLSHATFEKNSLVLLMGILIVVAIGGLVEIVPLFCSKPPSRRWRECGPTRRWS